MKHHLTKEEKEHKLLLYHAFYEFACLWVSRCFKPFTIDDIKKAYQQSGKDTTGLVDTSGILAKQLLKNGLVFKNGFTTKIRPNNKTQVVLSLISREYKEKQSNNRKSDKESLTKLVK